MRSSLILLPGMDGTGELFEPLIGALPDRVEPRVVAYPDRAASYAEHVAVARRELPRDRDFVLLGESFSGPVAVQLAAESPPGLRGLVLCVTFLSPPRRVPRWLQPFAALASPKLLPGFVADAALFGTFGTPALRAARARALDHVASSTLIARARDMVNVDVRPQLRSLAIPSLYLRGSRDRLVGARFGDEFLAHAARGELVDVDGPHMLLQTRPEECAQHISAFCARVS